MKVIVFDTETTGLVKSRALPLDHQPEVIEFYGCVIDLTTGNGVKAKRIVNEFDTLIKPKKPISDEIKKITGIDNDMVASARGFEKHAHKIKSFLEQGFPVVAHNFRFDRDMIEIEMERLGLKMEWPRTICTIEQTSHIKGHRLSMSNLHAHLFGVAFEGAHRAKADVLALVRCCVELHRRELL